MAAATPAASTSGQLLFDVGAGRHDLYWSGLWSTAMRGIAWTSAARQRQFVEAGLVKWLPKHLAADPDRALARLRSSWRTKLAIIGALHSWRTLTAQQLAQFTGLDVAHRSARSVLADLYALGAIEAGFAWTPGRATMDPDELTVYQLGRPKTLRRLLEHEMTYPETIAVTGGRGFSGSASASRHDMLAAELALRLVEQGEGVATVLGESQSRLADLAFTGPGIPMPPGFHDRSADLTVVRDDGVRIVFELTANMSSGFAAKAAAWTRALESRAFDDTGLVVVFVAAADLFRDSGSGSGPLRGGLSKAIRSRPGTPRNRTADRMLFVEWRDWFPASGKASAEFHRWRVRRFDGENWTPVDLADSSHLGTPANLRDPLAVVANASGLYATPPSLRVPQTQRPAIAALPLLRAGMPLPAGRRRGASGSIRTSTLPPRLRF